jgi:hypothetical protein
VLSEITGWLQVVLILLAGGSANNSVIHCRHFHENIYLEELLKTLHFIFSIDVVIGFR